MVRASPLLVVACVFLLCFSPSRPEGPTQRRGRRKRRSWLLKHRGGSAPLPSLLSPARRPLPWPWQDITAQTEYRRARCSRFTRTQSHAARSTRPTLVGCTDEDLSPLPKAIEQSRSASSSQLSIRRCRPPENRFRRVRPSARSSSFTHTASYRRRQCCSAATSESARPVPPAADR